MIVGVDASNIRGGGGVTHLAELLTAAYPEQQGIKQVVVWSGSATLVCLPKRPWLTKRGHMLLDGGIFQRLFWQRFLLATSVQESCDVLFVPGGNYFGGCRPCVAMSQNLLPFEARERARYGLSLARVRLALLGRWQGKTFREADGTLFLTECARTSVEAVTGRLPVTRVVPHGTSERFRIQPRVARPPESFSSETPFRLLYVSSVSLYKHQWHVAEAVHHLWQQGLHVALDLIGPGTPPGCARLRRTMSQYESSEACVRYLGPVPHESLPQKYERADAFVFASSCENMPIILLEAMAAGLPIACSSRGPMPEVLGDAGIYFDPERPGEIASAVRKLYDNPELRARLAAMAYDRARDFSWEKCARETFAFLAEVALNNGAIRGSVAPR